MLGVSKKLVIIASEKSNNVYGGIMRVKFFLSAICFLYALTHSAISIAGLFSFFGNSIPVEKEGDYALVVSRIGINGGNVDTGSFGGLSHISVG